MKVGDRVRDKLYKRGLGTVTELVLLDHPCGEEQKFRYCAFVEWDRPQPEHCSWYEDQCLSQEFIDDVKELKND